MSCEEPLSSPAQSALAALVVARVRDADGAGGRIYGPGEAFTTHGEGSEGAVQRAARRDLPAALAQDLQPAHPADGGDNAQALR
eukprot:8404882-Pyramimonas_sp.AAC.1